MTRTFIALEMNSVLQSQLEGVIQQLARALPSIRWVDPQGIHLTLAFLGELSDEEVAQAIAATRMAAERSHPFSYRLSRLGTFGSSRNPRVIWMGIDEPTDALRQLHRQLNRALERHGFAIDTRPFSPHLTLARVKTPLAPQEQQRLQDILNGPQQGIISHQPYPVEHINVIKSELSRTGARYTCLQECVLGRA